MKIAVVSAPYGQRRGNLKLTSFSDAEGLVSGSLSSTASSSSHTAVDSPVTRTGAFQWAKVKGNGNSDVESPHPSPQRAEHASSSSTPTSNISQGTAQAQATPTPSTTPSTNGRNGPPRPTRQESSDNLKSFKVSLEDPAWKVLPAALRKYKINNDDWQNYAMFICYGPPSAY